MQKSVKLFSVIVTKLIVIFTPEFDRQIFGTQGLVFFFTPLEMSLERNYTPLIYTQNLMTLQHFARVRVLYKAAVTKHATIFFIFTSIFGTVLHQLFTVFLGMCSLLQELIHQEAIEFIFIKQSQHQRKLQQLNELYD